MDVFSSQKKNSLQGLSRNNKKKKFHVTKSIRLLAIFGNFADDFQNFTDDFQFSLAILETFGRQFSIFIGEMEMYFLAQQRLQLFLHLGQKNALEIRRYYSEQVIEEFVGVLLAIDLYSQDPVAK